MVNRIKKPYPNKTAKAIKVRNAIISASNEILVYVCLMASERIILGVDPGTNIMGYGVIKILGNKPELI